MSSKAEIKITTDEITGLLNKAAENLENTEPLMAEIGNIMLDAIMENFEQEGRDEDGNTNVWPELSPVTMKKRAKIRAETSPILHVSAGGLYDSIQESHDSTSAVVSTNKIYANTHQFGAKKGEFGEDKHGRPLPWGDIPARPFMMVTKSDLDEIIEAFKRHLN